MQSDVLLGVTFSLGALAKRVFLRNPIRALARLPALISQCARISLRRITLSGSGAPKAVSNLQLQAS